MTSPSLPAVSNSGFWMLLPFSLLDHRNFVPRLSIYRHWKTLAFSFPLSLQVFHLFHWKACFQFFNTLRNCPWNLSHPGTTNKSTKWSTWEVTVLVLNDTRTQPLLELFILKLFTESCMSSPSYSIILEFCHQQWAASAPTSSLWLLPEKNLPADKHSLYSLFFDVTYSS